MDDVCVTALPKQPVAVSGYSISEVTTADLRQCMRLCLTDHCCSFLYNQGNKTCVTCTESNPPWTISNSDWRFYGFHQ